MALQHTALGALLLTAGGSLADECCCGGPPPDECTWFLSPDALQFDCNAQSGSFNINVPTGTNCGWEASVTSGGAYLTITAGFTGNTDGTVEFDLLGNPDPQRTAEITVVTTVVSPLGPIGTVIGVFTLTQDECATVPPGVAPGSGGGSPPPSGGTCTWSISPASVVLSCFAQSGFFNVNTQLGCGWAATVISGGAYITITFGATGSDAGSVFYSLTANPGVARGGQIEVRTTVVSSLGPIGTLIGLFNIAQLVCPGGGGGAPCSWRANGGWVVGNPCAVETGTFVVYTYAGCGWEAIAMDPWITITSGSTGLSTGTITFDIAANTTGTLRNGTIEVHATSASVLGPAGQLVGIVNITDDTCAPCVCPGAGPASLTIDGYAESMFDPFTPCGSLPGAVKWTGLFTGSFCTWNHSPANVDINNHRIAAQVRLTLVFEVVPCVWELRVRCFGGALGQSIWLGYKNTGDSPLGVYGRASGDAAGPATILLT